MGLTEVISDVRRDGEARAQKVLADAQREADALVASARQQAQEAAKQREAQGAREAEHARQQVLSSAESEARKLVLAAQAELRADLRKRLVDGFAKLPAAVRAKHVKTLLGKAQATIRAGRVWAAAQDEPHLKGAPYKFAGAASIAGGIIVESDDGTERLDLSYETLLGDLWRDVLKAEAGLFA